MEKIEPEGAASDRWKYVTIDRPQTLTVRMMDDSQRIYTTTYNAQDVTLRFGGGTTVLKSTRPDPLHLTLRGDAVSITLREVDRSKFLLLNRGFNWINERPFNR